MRTIKIVVDAKFVGTVERYIGLREDSTTGISTATINEQSREVTDNTGLLSASEKLPEDLTTPPD